MGRLVTVVSLALLGAEPTAKVYAGVPPVVIPLSEGFEAGLGAFSTFSTECSAIGCTWARVTSHANTGAYAAYADDVPQTSDQVLFIHSALAIPLNAMSATLTFWHLYDFESDDVFNYDGGVLEVSTDAGQTWTDAGANITAGGYTGTLSDTGRGNPLAGRGGWVFTSPAGWAQVTVDILPYRGPSVTFRWRLGTDRSNIGAPGGWWVDDVQVSYEVPSACDGSWSAASSYPIPAALSVAVGLNGTLYVFGGRTTTAIANAYSYSPGSDTWTPIASLPEPRYAASAVTDGTYIYILGGVDSNRQLSQTLWRYDTKANSYLTLAPYGQATALQAAAYVEGVIYRIAGERDLMDALATNTVEAYTIATNSWAAAAGHPVAVYGLASLTLDGHVYTAGGANPGRFVAKTYRYDPTSDSWDDGPIADLPGRYILYTAGTLYNGTWIVVANGEIVLGWDPRTNNWRSLDQMPQPVAGGASAIVGGTLYVVGGGGPSLTNAVQRYIGTNCATPTPTPSKSAVPTATQSPGPSATTPPPTQSAPSPTHTSAISPAPTGTQSPVPSATTAPPTQSAPSPTRTSAPPHACVGDCSGAGMVTIADLVKGVAIALNLQPLDACAAFDANQDGNVAVNELVAAVNNALGGCPAA